MVPCEVGRARMDWRKLRRSVHGCEAIIIEVDLKLTDMRNGMNGAVGSEDIELTGGLVHMATRPSPE